MSRPSARTVCPKRSASTVLLRRSAYIGPVSDTSAVVSVAMATPCAARSTRATSASADAAVRSRTYRSTVALAGTTFGAWPPSVTIPWIRAVGGMNCRSESRALRKSWAAASALRPSQGDLAAWALTPVKPTRRCAAARPCRVVSDRSAGWNITAASTPSKTPARASRILPAPPISSPGVPITATVPGWSGRARTAAIAAAAPPEAMRLCPQPCPMPGSASYSASTATYGPGVDPSCVATNAVPRPPAGAATAKPASASHSVSSFWAANSSNFSSGSAWIARLTRSIRGRRAATSAERARGGTAGEGAAADNGSPGYEGRGATGSGTPLRSGAAQGAGAFSPDPAVPAAPPDPDYRAPGNPGQTVPGCS
ncbi:hypothetical protein YWIDRAFT_00038 [Streptomyces sp. SceaMP-e96]|nr:hypothetical protein YWIDRAFT_00038 [Streptomyces sp. SceaMP-e96]